MPRLSAPQLRRLNQVLLELHEEVDGAEPLERIVDLVEKALPISWISVDEVALNSGAAVHRAGRRLEYLPQLEERVARFCHENPVVAFAMRGNFAPALRVSDFASFREIRQTGFYQEMARYLAGWRDQAAMPLRLQKSSLGFALNRDKRFSDEKLLIVELLQPHVERVLHRCTQYLHLPTMKPLTAREREVLHWVAEGKRDSEIALILRVSVRTIEQHVHVCLEKLAVETRSAATAAVWRARSRSVG